jgi:Lon-like ATP-dependent protease
MKITFPIFKTSMNVFVEETDAEKRRRKHRNNRVKKATEPKVAEQAPQAKTDEKKDMKEPRKEQFLMAEVENIVHNKFKQTEEVKALNSRSYKDHPRHYQLKSIIPRQFATNDAPRSTSC